ncbi:MAG: hypothetical protein ABH950_01010 [Candidatus Altiarchaeota archaeon]
MMKQRNPGDRGGGGIGDPMEVSQGGIIGKHWRNQESAFKIITSIGMEALAKEAVNLDKAFVLGDRGMRCIDEGTEGGIHGAGSLILLKRDEAVKIIQAAKIDVIYSHEGCGAAALAYQELGAEERDRLKLQYQVTTADEYGIIWAKTIANQAGKKYGGHIKADEMTRPKEGHIARIAYFDGTGQFDNSKRPEGFPPGFVVSRRILPPDYAAQEADISVSIATGNHGFGKLITPEAPRQFLIVPIGDPRNPEFSLKKLTAELGSSGIIEKFGGRVRIDGFTAPLK